MIEFEMCSVEKDAKCYVMKPKETTIFRRVGGFSTAVIFVGEDH